MAIQAFIDIWCIFGSLHGMAASTLWDMLISPYNNQGITSILLEWTFFSLST
jgi:hypothetical protein